MVLGRLAKAEAEWCRTSASTSSIRLTLIAANGTVICDSQHDPATMDNHNRRPEVLEARASGFGHSARHSDTLHEEMVYGALQISSEGLILRAAVPIRELSQALKLFDTSLVVFLNLAAILFFLLLLWQGKRLIAPLQRIIDQTESVLVNAGGVAVIPPEQSSYGEWVELEAAVERIRRSLAEKVEALNRERQELAALVSAISDAIIAVDLEGMPLFYNSRFALLFFHDNPSESVRLWERFRDPEVLQAFKSALKDGRPVTVKAVPVELVEGRRFCSLSVSPLRRSGGDVYGAIGVFHDVTELIRAEQIRIDFVANVSHELRTPLTSIKGYADTLVDDLAHGRPTEKSFVEAIARNSTRLMSLINDLLDLSSIESTGALNPVQVDPKDLTERVLAQMEVGFRTKKLEVDRSYDTPFVLADPARLEQVLVNLLDNARKYTPEGGQIRVSWKRNEGEVLLEVQDSGPGIPVEHQSRLFERFYRVDRGRSRDSGGTGLGLAIVKHILQRHGGSVSVSSELGRGCTFVCRFPIHTVL